MEKIPTAEEYLASKQYDWVEDINTTECMIEFAKLHVEAALKIANEEALRFVDKDEEEDYKPQIIDAYPLENIK